MRSTSSRGSASSTACACSRPRRSTPEQVPPYERLVRRADIFVDDHAGFHAVAVRHSLRMGFNRERWAHGHPIAFLDIDRAGHLPRWEVVDRALGRWLFSPHRYAPKPLLDEMRATCNGLVVTNLQAHVSMPYLVAARKLDVPVVGYVASWDHTVGQGHRVAAPRPLRRPERDDGARARALPRHRPREDHGHGLAADGRLPPAPNAGGVRGPARAATASTPAGRSSSSQGTRPTTRRTRAGSSRGWSVVAGERCVRALLTSLSAPSSRQPGRRAIRSRARASTESRCRSRATRISRISRRCSSTPTVSSRTPAPSCWTRSSTTGRPCASSSTRGRSPASTGPTATSPATTIGAWRAPGAFLEARDFDELTAAIDRSLDRARRSRRRADRDRA